MSKYVKYISSEHYGAPEMKGDRWGYLVEMLRTVLCTGFNERTDLIKFNVITKSIVQFTFRTPHHYVENQTIKVSDLIYPELNAEFVIESFTETTVTCKSYNDLTPIVNQSMDVVGKSIVSPLGFIEKFKDGNRSAFTTDEEEAYLCIDDEEPLNFWEGALSVGRTPPICPIVYMTDKKDDIDSDGDYIVPFSSSNPTFYKDKKYLFGNNGSFKTGLWNWISYGNNGNINTGNDNNDRMKKLKYDVIGNGRMFYFIPRIYYSTTSFFDKLFYFGKINNVKNKKSDLLYILNSTPIETNESAYSYNRIAMHMYNIAPSNYSKSLPSGWNLDIGDVSFGILKVDDKSSQAFIKPTISEINNSLFISGDITTYNKMLYPNKYDKKLYTAKLKVNAIDGYIGDISGLLYVYNSNQSYFNHGTIKKLNSNNFYIINSSFCSAKSYSNVSSKFIYFLSLNHKDWYNYD